MGTARKLMLGLLLAGLVGLVGGPVAQAQRPDTPGGQGGQGSRDGSGDHARPSRDAPAPLGFAQAQRVLTSASAVIRALGVGEAALLQTPQGQRASVPLLYQGQVVARAFLSSEGRLVALPRGPLLPAAARPSLTPEARSRLRAQVGALTPSGAIQATRGEYRVTLLLDGVPVATLRLNRDDLRPKPDSGLMGQPVEHPPDRPERH